MKQIVDHLTSPVATSIWAILAALAGLVVRRRQRPEHSETFAGRAQRNIANVRGDGNSISQTNHAETHNHVNVNGAGTRPGQTDDTLIVVGVGTLVFLGLALIGFSYANRLVPAFVGAVALFVAIAASSRRLSFASGLLAIASFAGFVFWHRIEYGDGALRDVVSFTRSPSDVFANWIALSPDQRHMFGTALVVMLVALGWSIAMAIAVVRERFAIGGTRSGSDWPAVGFTLFVLVAIVLTWTGVLPGQVQHWMA